MSEDGRFSIEMDGQIVRVEPGLTILEAARQNGIEIPTLCNFPGLPAHGSCRLCVVEIAGRENTPTACTTPVEAGMRILTHSPRVMALRKELLQMLLAEHPAGCLYCPENQHCDECMVTVRKAGVTTGCGSCPKNGQCELQTLAEQYEIRQPDYPIRYRMLPVESHDPFFDRDPNLCILCGRCVRVCQQLHFQNSLTYNGRGAQVWISTAFERPHLAADCVFCGSCVEICPTGALSEKTSKWDGRPERGTESTCPFCSIGCQISLLSKKERVTGSLPNRQAETEVLCASGRFGVPELVEPSTRMKHPQRPAGTAWRPVEWEEAILTAAEKLAACPPGGFKMRVSAWCSNEDLYVARQFARTVMQSTPVLASVQRRYDSALGSIARLQRNSVGLETLADAGVILCVGLDDAYAQSVVKVQLKKARERGAMVIHASGRSSRREPDWSDARVAAGPSDGAGLAGALAGLAKWLSGGRQDSAEDLDSTAMQAARLLAHTRAPVIVVGADVLAGPDNAAILPSIEKLAQILEARTALLFEESNLGGALRLGLGSHSSTDGQPPCSTDVLYLIGEPLPEEESGVGFVIAHISRLPEGGFNGLLLPAAAFSETDSTTLDYAGRLKVFRAAVPPPGESLPGWDVLARIARRMGATGFDYHCVEDIWQAAQVECVDSPTVQEWADPILRERDCGQYQRAGWKEPFYMDEPLSRQVAGLRNLYSGSSILEGHEPDS